MLRITNMKSSPCPTSFGFSKGEETDNLKMRASKILKAPTQSIKEFKISKKSIDARDKTNVKYVYSVDFAIENESQYLHIKNVAQATDPIYIVERPQGYPEKPVIVIGSGPAGLFAALTLAEAGCPPIILERGKDVDNRKKDIALFQKESILDENSNIQFGEGGAGAFSDGKLTTGTKDIRIRKVQKELVKAGAPREIEYLAKPHIGTDKLLPTVKNIRKKIESLGGKFHFQAKWVGFSHENNQITSIQYEENGERKEIETNHVICAIGHSARDTWEMLYQNGVHIEQKPFSIGVRIEHLQKAINQTQYGAFAKQLPAAEYKLHTHLQNGRGIYTFCMCPGGVVVGATSEKDMVVTNGMSNYARNEKNANSALLVSINPEDFPSTHPLSGIEMQRTLEKKAFSCGGGKYYAPAQTMKDFLNNKETLSFKGTQPTYKPGVTPSDLRDVLPPFLAQSLKEGALLLNKKLDGFTQENAVLTAIETRSSSPITIIRNEHMETNIKGLFPCGEGGGHAGGIMSAAVDGIKCAEKCLKAPTQCN